MNQREDVHYQALHAAYARVQDAFAEEMDGLCWRKEEIDAAYAQLIARTRLPAQPDDVMPKHPVRALLQAQQSAFAGWMAQMLGMQQEQTLQMAFRARFGDSCLVTLYGKVKAGKSALGNMLCIGQEQPGEDPLCGFFRDGDEPDIGLSVHEQARVYGFKVGVTETTSAIQGFQFPGLTIVDMPGTGSCTPENAQLAETYAGAADVLLFCMDSGSPGRRSDMTALESLLERGKPVLVVLTRSDVTEQRETEEGGIASALCMKSAADLDEQAAYVMGEIDRFSPECRANLVGGRVFPVSVRYAEAQGWAGSGFDVLAREMAHFAGAQSVACKRLAPRRALLDWCGKANAAARDMQAMLLAGRAGLEEARDAFGREHERVRHGIRTRVRIEVARLADQYAAQKDSRGFMQACDAQCRSILDEEMRSLLANVGMALGGVLDKMYQDLPAGGAVPEFATEFVEQVYRTEHHAGIGRSIGALTGALIGLAFGPVGAVVGTGLGGLAGDWVGSRMNESRTVEVAVGDNRETVIRAACDIQLARVCQLLDDMANLIDRNCFAGTTHWLASVGEAMDGWQALLCRHQTELEDI